MDLDIPGPDAYQRAPLRVMREPGGRHFLAGPGALPRKLRALVSVEPSLLPRGGQALVTILEQVARNVRRRENKERQHEDLGVPERVTAIAESRKGLGADVDAVIMARRSDEKLEEIEAHGELSFIVALDLDVTAFPLLSPGLILRFQRRVPILS